MAGGVVGMDDGMLRVGGRREERGEGFCCFWKRGRGVLWTVDR